VIANNETRTRQIGSWTIKERVPVGSGPHPFLLMLHGWTGDENSMWVFTTRLPQHYWIASPRAPHRSSLSGYSWRDETSNSIEANSSSRRWAKMNEYQPSAQMLVDLLRPNNFPEADLSQISLIGFSQGGAMCYTLALMYPEKVKLIAGLSTFMPSGAEPLVVRVPLLDKPVFVAHGIKDRMVPIDMARHSVELLEQAGANVAYCENDVGHKLGTECFSALEDFFLKYD
jgi:phospholipase/carboxylesterase